MKQVSIVKVMREFADAMKDEANKLEMAYQQDEHIPESALDEICDRMEDLADVLHAAVNDDWETPIQDTNE